MGTTDLTDLSLADLDLLLNLLSPRSSEDRAAELGDKIRDAQDRIMRGVTSKVRSA